MDNSFLRGEGARWESAGWKYDFWGFCGWWNGETERWGEGGGIADDFHLSLIRIYPYPPKFQPVIISATNSCKTGEGEGGLFMVWDLVVVVAREGNASDP